MRQSTIKQINNITDNLMNGNFMVLLVLGSIVACPFLCIYEILKWIYRCFRKRCPSKPIEHITPEANDRFLFRKTNDSDERQDIFIYVETEYDETIHRFFEDEKEWITDLQQWYGIDIIKEDGEEIKKKMVYPQDFTVFRHGFLWSTRMVACRDDVVENAVDYLYFDINPESEASMKEQIRMAMGRVYDKLLY